MPGQSRQSTCWWLHAAVLAGRESICPSLDMHCIGTAGDACVTMHGTIWLGLTTCEYSITSAASLQLYI